MTTVAIMQPTFLPWLGYFAMIEAADHFVFLDDVQFSRQSWQNRNRIAGKDGEILLSLGVARKPSKPLIKDAKLADTGFEVKLIQTVENCYRDTEFGAEVAQLIRGAFDAAKGNLCELNIAIIQSICELTEIKSNFVRSSRLELEPSGRSQRLIDITKRLNGETYLSPVGSLEYLRAENTFENSGVQLMFMNYEHPTYAQGTEEFTSHLAAVDALARLGPAKFRDLVSSGIRPALSQGELERKIDEQL